jgi:hypothetical protein
MVKFANKSAKAKPKPKHKLTDKEQSERFIEAARKLGIEQSGEAFDKAVNVILGDAGKHRDT